MNHLLKCSILLFSVLFASTSFSNNQECWNESKACIFSGTLETQIYPGPPGYENIKKGDAKEEGLYIRLDNPIMIHFRDWEKKHAPATKSISLMQITTVFDTARFYKVAAMKNKPHIAIKGTVFASYNAHHHTDFLIDAEKQISVNKK
jgi:hypothetical protein